MATYKACKYCCCGKTAGHQKTCSYVVDRPILDTPDPAACKWIRGCAAVAMIVAIAMLGGCASFEPGKINRWDCLISIKEGAPFYGPWCEYDPVLRYATAE